VRIGRRSGTGWFHRRDYTGNQRGKTAGNLNNVNFQSGTWSAQGKIVDADITFKDSTYGSTAVAANARYAQCQHTQPGIVMWLFQSMGAFAGSTDPAYSSTKSVGALAVATRASGQAICPIPIAVIRMRVARS